MKICKPGKLWIPGFLASLLFSPGLYAQTDQDALTMPQQKFCMAGLVGQTSWTHYWEGTFQRDNANLGRVTTKTAMLMANYGLRENLNIIAALPYVATKASAGTLAGMRGLQDASLFIKWRPYKWFLGKQQVSLFAIGGYSRPTSGYNVELLPMSIGLGSQVLSTRLLADLQAGRFTFALAGAYLHRSHVDLDREAYYTDHQVYSNEVDMPDAGNFQVRAGYRTPQLIAEVIGDNLTTFGGFDMRKNDMPFVSNRMNSTRAGVEVKYYPGQLTGLGVQASAWHTLAGRNVGQATGFMAGLSYILDFSSQASQ